MRTRSWSNNPKCTCGHRWKDHGQHPPYTGYMWCEGAGSDDDWWICSCREYEGLEPRQGWGWR